MKTRVCLKYFAHDYRYFCPSILNSEEDIVAYDIIRLDRLRREGRVPRDIIKSLSYNHKLSFCPHLKAFLYTFLAQIKVNFGRRVM